MQRGVGRVGVIMGLYGTGGRFEYSKKQRDEVKKRNKRMLV